MDKVADKVVDKVEEGTEDKVVDKAADKVEGDTEDKVADKVEEDMKDVLNRSMTDSKDQHNLVSNPYHSTYTLSSVANEDHVEVAEEHLNPMLVLLAD